MASEDMESELTSGPQLRPGQRFGSYRIVRLLDSGGMGFVYEAEHVNLKARCALKVFETASQQRDFLRRRFLVEGKILAAFRHPRIVRVTDLAVDEESDTPYFVMDLVLSPDGSPLTLEQARRRGVSEDEVAGWFRDICEGLAYIHAKGVVHRDISLENIMVGPDGHAVITDFGIARIFDLGLRRRVEQTRFTIVEIGGSSLRMGKEPYMAPELLASPPKPASPASDAWALGIAVFRLLTGFWFSPERRENSLQMLDGMEYDWQSVVGRLLRESRSDRLGAGGIGELVGALNLRQPESCWRKWLKRLLVGVSAAAMIAGVVVTSVLLARRPSDRQLQQDAIVSSFLVNDPESETNGVSEAYVSVWFDVAADDMRNIADVRVFLENDCLAPFVEELFEGHTSAEVRRIVLDDRDLVQRFAAYVDNVDREQHPDPKDRYRVKVADLRLAVW